MRAGNKMTRAADVLLRHAFRRGEALEPARLHPGGEGAHHG